ncbi:hypothetical protein SAY86_008733 [Trapa natans]|uniref:Exocyst complex component n=1 Tax=Trapa natans TaxID=22666 RepID=A0AAN7QEX6_TRANT|nr:hypothetical protein SAY86_008733 [Trapa natans]
MTYATRIRRRVAPYVSGDYAEKQEQHLLSSAVCNNEDLGPFIRKVFATGKPDWLLYQLRNFSRSKESEIEDICKAHYQDFILAVDDLRSLLSDADSLKSSIHHSNSTVQSVAVPLLSSLHSLIEARNISVNIKLAFNSVLSCVKVMDFCSRANLHLSGNNFYMALKCVDAIEGEFLDKIPSLTLQKMLQRKIPEIRSYIERKVSKEFGDWLVQIRAVSRHIGQLAIRQASAARQREEDLRIRQREAEEQSRLSVRDCVYSLQEEEDDDGVLNSGAEAGSNSDNGEFVFDLTQLYRAYHIHRTLGLEDRFKQCYFENRKLQMISDFQVSSITPFIESHQTFLAQIAGFFIVEDRIMRTSGGLISKLDVENLWETAVGKIRSVLEDQFSKIQIASHLLLIKDYVSLLGVTLRSYGYPVDALLDVLRKHRDKYHVLLLSDCQKQIADVLSAEKFEQMLMKKEYEYSMNVLSFQLQTTDIVPAFPYVAPFSSTVPDCCRIVRSFIEDSVSFMSYGGQLDFYDVEERYLDRLLSDVLDGALRRIINTYVHGVSQAMQVAANMEYFERACDFLFHHAAQLSGLPARMVDRRRRQFPLQRARDAAEEVLSGLLRTKVDGFMMLIENINWMADEPPQSGNEYVNEVIIYLETVASTAQQVLPIYVLKRVLQNLLSHISEKIVGALNSDTVKRFNVNSLMGFDVDIRLLESFVDNQASLFSSAEPSEMKDALSEGRQMINLLLSDHPENFLNPVIRESSYSALDHRKVLTISEKFKDASDGLFSSFGTRGSRQNLKRRSLDILIKRLKAAN